MEVNPNNLCGLPDLQSGLYSVEFNEFDSEDWVLPTKSDTKEDSMQNNGMGNFNYLGGASGLSGYTIGGTGAAGGGLGDYVTTGGTIGGLYTNTCSGCNYTLFACNCNKLTSWPSLTYPSISTSDTEIEQLKQKNAELEQKIQELQTDAAKQDLDTTCKLSELAAANRAFELRFQAIDKLLLRKDHENALKAAAEAVSEKVRKQLKAEDTRQLKAGDVVFTKPAAIKMIAVQPTRLTATEKHPDGPDKGAGERRLPLVVEDAWSCHDGKQFVAMPAALLEKRVAPKENHAISNVPVSHLFTVAATFIATLSAVYGSYLATLMF